MSKAISNSYTLQSCNFTLFFILFAFDLGSNGRGILSCIALSEDEQRLITWDSKLAETSIAAEIQFLKSIVKIVGNFLHVFAVWSRLIVRISITQASSDRLINKQYVVVLYPCELIFFDFEGRHRSWFDKMRAQFHEISQLTGWSWSSIEPYDSRSVLEVFLGGSLSSIKHEC